VSWLGLIEVQPRYVLAYDERYAGSPAADMMIRGTRLIAFGAVRLRDLKT
jgi:hypothetical protein